VSGGSLLKTQTQSTSPHSFMESALNNLEITDAHHHLWDLDAHVYPWLTDSIQERVCGEYAAIRKNYTLDRFKKDIGDLKVTRTVHVEAVIDPTQVVQETAWLQTIADGPRSGGIPHGIVAHADFRSEDLEETLDGHCHYSNSRGIRDSVHEGWIDPTNPKPTPLQDPSWREAVGLCMKYDLHFELQVYYQQVEEAIELLKRHPDLPMVLTHTGCPASNDPHYREGWKNSMLRLAEWPQLQVKLSGFGMFDRNWTAESVRPIILDTLEVFGVDRCMFASNFPVDSLACGYQELWSKYFDATLDLPEEERRKLFSQNANRFYRLS
jgi:predicted TIM-barrel fold metal-dependent hydrolase